MKHFLTILMIILFANVSQAQSNYNDLWDNVKQLEAKGLPKSALEIVQQIEEKAYQDKNTTQHIKALIFKSKFALILEEDAQLSVILNLKNTISQSEFPTKNVLENILANLYWQYFKQHRWQFYNRTHTDEKVDESDFRTWDLQTLFDEIHLHFKASLDNGLLLQQEHLNQLDAILTLHSESKIYRPTLFDFLAHNALEFYKTDENSITKPAYKFEISDPLYLSDASTFSKLQINSKDTSSLQLNALKIYQDLIQFHLKDTEPYALADVDIQRLLYVNQHATFNDKDVILLDALQTETNRLSSHEVSGLYNYEIANIYNQQGSTYQPKTNDQHRWKKKEALALCNIVNEKFPNSKAAKKCAVLKQQIEDKTLQLTAESFVPINTNSRVLIRYKNINQINFKVFALSKNQLHRLYKKYRKDEQLSFIKRLNLVKQWSSDLRNDNDYQSHTTEVLLPELPNGIYVIFGSPEKSEEQTFGYATLQSTNLAIVEKNDEKNTGFQVIDRRNGLPIANTKVALNYQLQNSNSRKTEHKTTNALGEIVLTKHSELYSQRNRYNHLNIDITYNNDKAYFDNYYTNHYFRRHNNDELKYNSFVFTDRSIYRPGQTVYFKGITMKSEHGKSEVIANQDVNARLYNTNRELVTELKLKTNDFGSAAGEFILPNSGLTGQFTIEFGNGMVSTAYFSVEEYKRPKFETTFKPIKDTFKVNDSITIKGHALAYAGSHISNAKVVYRVHRKVQYPRWFYWYRPWANSEPQEITHGESITNDKGEFEITFKALPDQSVDKTNLPIFNYEITADVTDINGETRSATTVVNVGYHALTASIFVDGKLNKAKKDQVVSIDTRNLNGEFVAAKGTIKIYKLQAPNYVLRQRPWLAPDYQEFSLEEFKQLFPHDAYSNEDNSSNWKKGKLVLEKSFDTEKAKELKLGKIKNWDSGQYIILLETKDKFGQFVKDEAKTILYSKADKTVADKQLFSITTNKSAYKSGDKVSLKLASAGQINVTIDVEKDQNIVNTYVVALNNNSKTLSIPVTKDDVGGFAVHYSFSAYNDYKSGIVLINVPFPKTDLEIETLTFRDKLQPGTDETWSFKIKGPKGDKVSAELLASMYDASLDQFQTHDWYFNPIQRPTYYSSFNRNARRTFGTANFRVHKHRLVKLTYTHQSYDQLNWYGLHFGNFMQYRRQYLKKFYTNKPSSYTSEKKSSVKSGYIEGYISDYSGPLPGVSILIKGTKNGTQTDFDGNFKLAVKKGATIQISYVGLNGLDIKINSDNYYKIILTEDAQALDEVVVTAQGIKREKKALGYAVSEESIDKLSYANDDKWSPKNTAGIYEGDNLTRTDTIEGDISSAPIQGLNKKETDFSGVTIRKNLQETAFFFPQLQTDKNGNVSFNFTTPEALTKWKLQLLAHTKNLESAVTSLETVTQKELMVIPNAPRFLREGDQITISTKIANLSDKELSGTAVLQLFDALTGTSIDGALSNAYNELAFTVGAKGNTQVSWNLDIPDTVQAVQYKILAKAGDFSDGEQNALPVLSNRMLVTESMPMWIRSNQTKTFTLDKLKNTTSSSLKHHKLTLEMTSNPAWYAVQALPYLMEYPYECNEQTFSRYYANALASHIANSNPRIQEVFNQWKNTDALLSNLEKNQELKSLLIQETPWLRDAQSETEQKKRIALLFDLNKMNNELTTAMRKLENGQMSSGAWSWFNGGRENRWITQHIMNGFGHLKQLNVDISLKKNMLKKAIKFLDAEFVKEYKDIRKYDKDVDLNKDHLSYTQLHYLYMRSFFGDISKSKQVQEITAYYHTQIQKYWLSRPLYAKGLMALITHRMDDSKTAGNILKSLKENSITSEELGMYWKSNTRSWYWYQAPIETQALLIEAFSEIENDVETVDNLKIWLLKNKQTNRWKTTKATTEAVYALLLQGSDWLSVTDMVDVVLGSQKLNPSKLEDVKVEAGTGYYKTSWSAPDIKPEMADVTITKKGNGIAWGSLYWQYFEDLDNITSAETPLKLKKKLFLKTNTDKGEEISEITESTTLQVGDLVRVRIELRSDRAMEFVHMKDMRASGLEPVNVLSQYKWQDGLGYYESTKDAATNFFFDYLPKGVYVFEYDLRVNNAGNMSNGITTIQSMYAPEFSSHSEGTRIQVK